MVTFFLQKMLSNIFLYISKALEYKNKHLSKEKVRDDYRISRWKLLVASGPSYCVFAKIKFIALF